MPADPFDLLSGAACELGDEAAATDLLALRSQVDEGRFFVACVGPTARLAADHAKASRERGEDAVRAELVRLEQLERDVRATRSYLSPILSRTRPS